MQPKRVKIFNHSIHILLQIFSRIFNQGWHSDSKEIFSGFLEKLKKSAKMCESPCCDAKGQVKNCAQRKNDKKAAGTSLLSDQEGTRITYNTFGANVKSKVGSQDTYGLGNCFEEDNRMMERNIGNPKDSKVCNPETVLEFGCPNERQEIYITLEKAQVGSPKYAEENIHVNEEEVDKRIEEIGNFQEAAKVGNLGEEEQVGSPKESGEVGSPHDHVGDGSSEVMGSDFSLRFRVLVLTLLGLVEFLCGAALSILAPFYTSEATDHGLTITQSSTVFASVFILQIFLTPLFGKYLNKLGGLNLLLYGSTLAGLANVAFGALAYIQSGEMFFGISLLLRGLIAVGESGINTSVYPLARSMASEGYCSTALSMMETLYGLGATMGPFIGGLLFELGGFYLPFMVCGTSLVIVGVSSAMLLNIKASKCDESNTEEHEVVKFRQVLKKPRVILTCLLVILTGMSAQWYQPTLEPYLSSKFGLKSVTVSLFLVIDGGMYALLSPIWGILLDKGLSAKVCMGLGSGIISLSYILMGPILIPIAPSPSQIAVAMTVNGVGMAANFIGSLTMLGDEIECRKDPMPGGANPNKRSSDQAHGIATSLWITCECIGSFLGSLLGGVTFERLGWEESSLVMSLVIFAGMISISLLSLHSSYMEGIHRTIIITTSSEAESLLRKDKKQISYGSTSINGDVQALLV